MRPRLSTPSRLATPGDLAPLALAPVQAAGQSNVWKPASPHGHGRGHLPEAPPLPTCPPTLTTVAAAAGRLPDLSDYDIKLQSLGVRQNGFEQRLFQLAELFAGIAEEQSGQARRVNDLGVSCQGACKRLDVLEGAQHAIASGLMAPRGSSVGSTATIHEAELMEIRKDAQVLRQALVGSRDQELDFNVNASGVGQTAAGGIASRLVDLSSRMDVHDRRLLLLTNTACRHWLHNPVKPSRDDPLRIVFWQWHSVAEVVNRRKAPADPESLGQQLRAAQVRMLEHGGLIEDLQDRADKHELQLVKFDSALDGLRCSSVPPAIQNGGLRNNFAATVEVLEMLAGQAKAVEDLDFLVREELRVGRQLAESAARAADHPPDAEATDKLAEHIAEQGRAITELRDVVEDLGNKVEHTVSSPVKAQPNGNCVAPLPDDIVERVGQLEGQTACIQRNLAAVVAAVRQIRDHAADALDDRVVAAMAQVHRRLAASIASVHAQVQQLSAGAEDTRCPTADGSHEGSRGADYRSAFVLGWEGAGIDRAATL